MSHLSPAGFKRRILHKFEHAGRRGQETQPFDSLPVEAQAQVLRVAENVEGELPILISFQNEQHWTLMTTARLISIGDEGRLAHSWSQIEAVSTDEAEWSRIRGERDQPKLHLKLLGVRLIDSSEFLLELEPGKPFFGFWSAMGAALNMS